MRKFLRKFEGILERLCKAYQLQYRMDRAKHGYQYFISREGYGEFCVQIASTPRNRGKLGYKIKKDLLDVLRQLDVTDPDLTKITMSFLQVKPAPSVWDEIDELPDLYEVLDED